MKIQVGQVFNKWTIIKEVDHLNNRGKRYLCRCDCGTEKEVDKHSLTSSNSKSCGCVLKNERIEKAKKLEGQVFGMLTVIKLTGTTSKSGNYYYECECECGNITTTTKGSLTRYENISCGCRSRELASKRMSKYKNNKAKKEYSIYKAMIDRCYNKKSTGYKDYGGRGIKVCDRWLESFDNFYEDMGKRPSSNVQLDREDNSKGYSSENCRWVTPQENTINRRKAEDWGITINRKGLYDVRVNRDYSYKAMRNITTIEESRIIRDLLFNLYKNNRKHWDSLPMTVTIEDLMESED